MKINRKTFWQRCLAAWWLSLAGIVLIPAAGNSVTGAADQNNAALNQAIIKNVYIYLDASQTIVEKEANDSPHLRITDYLTPLFDPGRHFTGKRDRVHITFFHTRLNKVDMPGIPGEDFEAITQRLQEYAKLNTLDTGKTKDSFRTNITRVVEDIGRVLEEELKENEFNVFIIASDFIHDPKNNICREEDVAEIRGRIESVSEKYAADFSNNARNHLILIPIPPPEKYIQAYPECMESQKEKVLGAMKTKFNAIEFQVDGGLNGAQQLLEKIRRRMAKWIVFEESRFVSSTPGKQNLELLVTNPSPFPVRLEGVDIKLKNEPDYTSLQGNDRPWLLPEPVVLPASGTNRIEMTPNPDVNQRLEFQGALYIFPNQNTYPDIRSRGFMVELPSGILKILSSRATLVPGKLKSVQIQTEIHLSGKNIMDTKLPLAVRLRDKNKNTVYHSWTGDINITKGTAGETITFNTDNPEVLVRDIDKILVEAECGELIASSELSVGRFDWYRNYIFTFGFSVIGCLLQLIVYILRYRNVRRRQKKIELMELISGGILMISTLYTFSLKLEIYEFNTGFGLIWPALALGLVLSTLCINWLYRRRVNNFIKDSGEAITYEKFTRRQVLIPLFLLLFFISPAIWFILWLTI